MPRRTVAAIALVGLALTACSDGDSDGRSPAPSTSEVAPSAESTTGPGSVVPGDPVESVEVIGVEVARLDEPIMMLAHPDDDRLWIAERAGRIRSVHQADDGTLEPDPEPLLDISSDTTAVGEQGLLGFAFSADGATLHVSYTNLDGDSRVDSWDLVDDTVDPSSRRTIFAVEQPFPNHNGGHLALDPDGNLHLGLGDGGAGGDPDNRAQDDDSSLGKLLRLDPDGGDPHIVAKGLRNPWRFDFDLDGSLWIADVGQDEWEEIDHVGADELAGANFGWSGFEGEAVHDDDPERTPDEWVRPVHVYDHDDGRCSITGGFVYRGEALPHLDGAFLFADLCEGIVRAVAPDDAGGVTVLDLGVEVAQPFSFGRDAAGEPHVLSADGSVIALVPAR